MARHPRYDPPGQPQHVIQRGNDRVAMFVAPADYERFRAYLQAACLRHGCLVHAYVLMTNHVHLLVTPTAPAAIGRVMQSVGRRYVQPFNRRHDRTGTLWEGRYKAAPIDTEHYLLTCYRYIERNPVRAGMVDCPADYRWSAIGRTRAELAIRSSRRTNSTRGSRPAIEPAMRRIARCAPSSSRRRRRRHCAAQPRPAGFSGACASAMQSNAPRAAEPHPSREAARPHDDSCPGREGDFREL